MTSDVSCPRCGAGYWVTNPEGEPWSGCSECEPPSCCCGWVEFWPDGAVQVEFGGVVHRTDEPCHRLPILDPDHRARSVAVVVVVGAVIGLWVLLWLADIVARSV